MGKASHGFCMDGVGCCAGDAMVLGLMGKVWCGWCSAIGWIGGEGGTDLTWGGIILLGLVGKALFGYCVDGAISLGLAG